MAAICILGCYAATEPWFYALTKRDLFFVSIPLAGLIGYAVYWWANKKINDNYVYGVVGENQARGRKHKETGKVEVQLVESGDWVPVSGYFEETFIADGDL